MQAKRYDRQDGKLFRTVFGRNLSEFWSPLYGFDVVKFDEELVKPSPDESTADVLKRDRPTWVYDLIVRLNAI